MIQPWLGRNIYLFGLDLANGKNIIHGMGRYMYNEKWIEEPFQIDVKGNIKNVIVTEISNTNSRFAVVWSKLYSGQHSIFCQIFSSASNKIGNEFRVNTGKCPGICGNPIAFPVAVESFVIMWTNHIDGNKVIVGKVYEGGGRAQGI